MSESVRAANAAFDELNHAGKATEQERVTFLFGFAAGIAYAEYCLSKRTGRPAPPLLRVIEQPKLEHLL
jgi:hypothetical protein